MNPRLNVMQIILRSFIHYRTNYSLFFFYPLPSLKIGCKLSGTNCCHTFQKYLSFTLTFTCAVPLHDALWSSDLRLICLAKKRKIRFRILSDFRIQCWILLKKRTLKLIGLSTTQYKTLSSPYVFFTYLFYRLNKNNSIKIKYINKRITKEILKNEKNNNLGRAVSGFFWSSPSM